MDTSILCRLFEDTFGKSPDISQIAGGGSPREYFRISYQDVSVAGVLSEDVKENEIFLSLASMLCREGINVPEVINVSDDGKAYLLEDLGDTLLFEELKGENKMQLTRRALDALINFQLLPEDLWREKVGYKPFSGRLVNWDLNYFKYDFLKPAGIFFDEEKLEDDFELLRTRLASEELITGLMYRDFQSRNVMVKDGDLWLIDFQGARKGPVCYDSASFVWQAKAPFTYEEREELTEYYASELSRRKNLNIEKIREQLRLLILFRTLQVMGAYGFRGLIEGKKHFIESIPAAIANINYLKEKGLLADYPEIEAITERLEAWQEKNKDKSEKKAGEENGLTIRVFSFSYKKGYPDDESGNGGGFIFDCRGMHNPGRYEEYKQKTGLDREVIEFLEERGEAREFVETCVELTIPTIKRYIARGFTSLLVGFGCTGGQHRSVFCAEGYAKKISELLPDVKIITEHREQNIVTHMGVTDKN